MKTCCCPIVTHQMNEEITFRNDRWGSMVGSSDRVFFMTPECRSDNAYGIGGVCEFVHVPVGDEVVFDSSRYGGPMHSPGVFGYFTSRGVIVARMTNVGTVEAMWVNVGDTITSSDFSRFKERAPVYHGDAFLPKTHTERVWEFSLDEFRDLSNNKKLFERLTFYTNPREYRQSKGI